MQSIVDLLSVRKIEDVVQDIKRGDTCVLMKPKGVKIIVTGPPIFNVGDKTGRPLNMLDLITSDLYVNPYMHLHKIKSKIRYNEMYELVHSYADGRIFLSSIKTENGYINDYRVLQNRAELYDLTMPIIAGLNMDSLLELIQAPEVQFKKLKLSTTAYNVMFLNPEYQATLDNPHVEKPLMASDEYIILLKNIFKNKPESLPETLHSRFIEILKWIKAVDKVNTIKDIKLLKLPPHVLTMQDFTLTLLPKELYKFLKTSKMRIAIFRMILMILSGKGYKEGIHIDKAASKELKLMTSGLRWDI